MDQQAHPVPAFGTSAEYEAVRRMLTEAGYSPEGVTSTLRRSSALGVGDSDLPLYLHRTRGGSPLETFIRLFLLEQSVSDDAANEAVASSLDAWVTAGLLTRTAGDVSSTVKLLPYDNLLLAADRTTDIRSGAGTDIVMNMGHATELLAFTAIPPGGGDTLDIGCGCGALALLQAAGSGKVLASDIAPRAIAFTEFNARLNGISNVAAVEGDMFAPAESRAFDRIVCNPPFVIAPKARYIFRDSGRRGDEFCRELSRAAPPLLNEGGYFQMLANIPHIAGRDWRADWQQWFLDLGCDCVVWANETCVAADYAATWIRDTESAEADGRTEVFEQWMAYFESHQIEAVTYGVVTMRKRTGENFILIDDTDRKFVGPCGDLIERAFRLEDYWRRFPTESELLKQSFVVSPNVSLVETQRDDGSGRLEFVGTEVRLTGGIELETKLDQASVAVIEKCDGRSSLEQIIPMIAARFNVPEENLAAAMPTIVAQLARRGYLTPVGFDVN